MHPLASSTSRTYRETCRSQPDWLGSTDPARGARSPALADGIGFRPVPEPGGATTLNRPGPNTRCGPPSLGGAVDRGRVRVRREDVNTETFTGDHGTTAGLRPHHLDLAGRSYAVLAAHS